MAQAKADQDTEPAADFEISSRSPALSSKPDIVGWLRDPTSFWRDIGRFLIGNLLIFLSPKPSRKHHKSYSSLHFGPSDPEISDYVALACMGRGFWATGAAVSLIAGGSMYLLLRPTTLLMFHWVEAAGLSEWVLSCREDVRPYRGMVPNLAAFSLPFGLWVAAYLCFVNAVWGYRFDINRAIWWFIVPALSVASEIGQGLGIVPGRYDPVDITVLVLTPLFLAWVTRLLSYQRELNEELR